MPCKQLACEGMDELKKMIAAEQGGDRDIFVLFTGKADPTTGDSWCPDCVAADPVIEKCVPEISDENVFIVCVVGDRPTWKDPKCIFRTDPDTKLKGIPTLVKWGTKGRLNSDECAKADLVSMLFTED